MNLEMRFELRSSMFFYDIDSGMVYCLLDVPDRCAVEKHHSKFGIKCEWITPVKMTARYEGSGQADE
jgi:hypothetical protein